MDEVLEELTPKELEVVEAIKQGCITDEAIAEKLCITRFTVSCHMQKLYQKLKIDGSQKRATLVYKLVANVMAEMMKECLKMGVVI